MITELTPTEDLSLTQLHQHLQTAGVDIAYSSLSQFINNGDIAEQLKSGGGRNRRTFPRWAAQFLAGFLPTWLSSKMQNSMAPDAMRHALKSFYGPTPGAQSNGTQLMRTNGTSPLPVQHPSQSSSDTALERLADLLAERAKPQEDKLLTAEQAADLLACKPRSVSRYVKPVLPRKFKQSDILAYIDSL